MTIFPSVGLIAQKRIFSIAPHVSVAEASRLMDQRNLSSVIVESGRQSFLFSIEQLLAYLAENGDINAPLADLALPVLPCITENQHVLAALECLEASAQRYLGVLRNDALTGILTYTDLLAAISPTVLVEKKTVGDLISKSELVTFSPDWILEDIFCHFQRLEDSVVVVEDGVALGIITTKDVFRTIAAGKSIRGCLPDYMSKPVITTRTTATVQEALDQFKSNNIKRSVVIGESGCLVGVITQSELVGFVYSMWINLTKYHSNELRELIAGMDWDSRNADGASKGLPALGIESRAALQQKLEYEINRIYRYQSAPFSVVLLGIACQQTNGNHVPLVSEQILRQIALELPQWVRVTDGVALWNRTTFAVLLPHTDAAGGDRFVSRIKSHMQSLFGDDAAMLNIAARQIDSKEQLYEFLADADAIMHPTPDA